MRVYQENEAAAVNKLFYRSVLHFSGKPVCGSRVTEIGPAVHGGNIQYFAREGFLRDDSDG